MMTLAVLFVAHNIHIFFAGGTFIDRCKKVINNLTMKTKQDYNKEDINYRITSLLVVAALIAGATFAASVQIGSSNSDSKETPPPSPSPSQKKAAEKKQTALKFFTVCNTLAMYTSITAAIALCWAQLQDMYLAAVDVWISSLLVAFALYMTCFAFFASVYMLADVGNEFILTMAVLQSLFLLFVSVRSVQLIVPFLMKKLFILFVYFYHAVVYYVVYCFALICLEWCCFCCLSPCKKKE